VCLSAYAAQQNAPALRALHVPQGKINMMMMTTTDFFSPLSYLRFRQNVGDEKFFERKLDIKTQFLLKCIPLGRRGQLGVCVEGIGLRKKAYTAKNVPE